MDDPTETARGRMENLFRRADGLKASVSTDSEFVETFSEILEELEVAGEELRQQNEELISTRGQLENERERYQELFEFAPDAYLVTNPRGIIQEANQVACQMLNVPYSHLIGKPLVVFVRSSPGDYFRRVMVRAQPQASFEMRVVPLKRDALDVAITLQTVFDTKHKPKQMRWMMRDITERNRVVAALSQSEDRFRKMFQESKMGILLISPKCTFVRANPAFLSMVGYSEDELVGRKVGDITFPDDLDSAQAVYQDLRENDPEDSRLQMRYQRKNGGIAWADVSLSLLRDEQGGVQHILCMTEDITAKRAYQAELDEMRRRLLESGEVERLRLAQELHDGPMQDLYGLVFRLADYLTQNNREITPDVETNLRETQEVIKQVAGTLRAVCGELRPPTIANLGLERAIRSHAESIQAKHPGLEIKLHLTSDGQALEPHIRMAFFRIYQQAMNNILRHAEATSVQVSFIVSDDEVMLDVWDNGKGFSMPDKWVDFLREGHYGLAGIAERVDALGGQLQIETKPGGGTLVHVTAPRPPKA